MKLLYIANARIPTEKAHGLHIVKMCEAFVAHGEDVTLVLPRRKNAIIEDIFSYYGIKRNFIVQYIHVIDWVECGFFGYWINQVSFAFGLLFKKFDKIGLVVFTRDELSGWLLSKFGYKVFYDMHGFPIKWMLLWKIAMKSMLGIVCTNQWKIEQCCEKFGLPRGKLLLARNGFDQNIFSIELTKNEARKAIGQPENKSIAVYAGHLYDWKGVDIIVAAAKLMPEVLFIIVGGGETEIKNFKNRQNLGVNVEMVGQRPHKEVYNYLRAADVLLLPNSVHSVNSRFSGYSVNDTSPIKMFEYMASGRPVVASDLPSIGEVLNPDNSVLIKPDDAIALAKWVGNVLSNRELAERLSKKAISDAQKYTWDKRVEKIIGFIKRLY